MDRRKRVVAFHGEFDPGREGRPYRREGLRQHTGQRDRRGRVLPLAGVRQELPGQLRGAVRHPPDHVEVLAGLGDPPGVHRKEFDGALDPGENVIELVGDPAGEYPDRGERLALGESRLHFSSHGDVARNTEDATVPFRTFRERGRRRLHVHEPPVGAPHPVRKGRIRLLPAGRETNLRDDLPGIVGVKEPLEGRAVHQLRADAKHREGRRARVEDASRRVVKGDEVGGVLREEAVPRLGLAQPVLGPPALQRRGEDRRDHVHRGRHLAPPRLRRARDVQGHESEQAGPEPEGDEQRRTDGERLEEPLQRIRRRQEGEIVRLDLPLRPHPVEQALEGGAGTIRPADVGKRPRLRRRRKRFGTLVAGAQEEAPAVGAAQGEDLPAHLVQEFVEGQSQGADPRDPRHGRDRDVPRREPGPLRGASGKRDRLAHVHLRESGQEAGGRESTPPAAAYAAAPSSGAAGSRMTTTGMRESRLRIRPLS